MADIETVTTGAGTDNTDVRDTLNEVIGAVNAGPGGDPTSFAAAMGDYLAALPTADPADGTPWLDAGVFTVSTVAP